MSRALLFLLMCWALPLGAVECRQALVLALDVSSSVDAREDALQRRGVAAALLAGVPGIGADARVLAILSEGPEEG